LELRSVALLVFSEMRIARFPMKTRTLPLLTFSLLLLVALGLAACSDDDDGGDSVSVCDQQGNVQAAVEDLANVNVLADGTTALQDGIDNVRSELQGLRDAVEEDIQDEVDAFTTAVTTAQDTFASLGDGSSINDQIDEVQAALTAVVESADALRDALSQECD
jgi:hypothetical protein